MRYGVRKKKELVLWGILCVGLILLYLLSSTDWIIKEKEVEVYPVSLIISDTSDDDYVNFRKGVDQAAVEYNVEMCIRDRACAITVAAAAPETPI